MAKTMPGPDNSGGTTVTISLRGATWKGNTLEAQITKSFIEKIKTEIWTGYAAAGLDAGLLPQCQKLLNASYTHTMAFYRVFHSNCTGKLSLGGGSESRKGKGFFLSERCLAPGAQGLHPGPSAREAGYNRPLPSLS